ncbi:MAG: transglutaminase domain-containing protein [Bacteroidales bacterium]|nr:transglutaminase domain-containing protein [Bacteroidales bacterium]
MTSRPTRLPLSAVFLFLLSSLNCLAQPAQEMAKFKAKYPGHSVISEIKRKEITITAGSKGLPEIKSYNQSSLMLLTGNVTTYADSKEYFNKNFKLNYLKAYSLLPGEKEYKKAEVSEFSKSSEINGGLYFDDNYSLGFTFPSVGPGVKMVSESEIIFSTPYYPVLFYFGSSIPSDSAVLEITMPETVELNYKIFGNDAEQVHFSKTIKGKKVVYQWYTSGLKAYQSEDYSPDPSYYIPHIIIHIASVQQKESVLPIMGNARDLYTWHYGHISKLDSLESPAIKQLVDSLTAGIQDETERVKTIYRWVQKNVKYIAIEDGDNGQVPGEAAVVLAHRYGDCKGKSSLLRAMLRAAGSKASLAWIGSRDIPYKYSEFPSMSNDDHMICIWWNKGEPVALDGTTENHALGQIPSFIQGKETMVENGPGNLI